MSTAARHVKARRVATRALEKCPGLIEEATKQHDQDQIRLLRAYLLQIVETLDAPNVEQEAVLTVFTRGLNGEKERPHKRTETPLRLVSNNA